MGPMLKCPPTITILKIALQVILPALIFTACHNTDYYPKPRGYFRIDLPEKSYRTFDSTFPYTFEYPDYARITFDENTKKNPYWMDLDFPRFKGRIYFSYKSLDRFNLYTLTEDAREMAFKHAPKAVGIKESVFNNPKADVYGLAYTIEGKDAASPYQFYLTDSTKNFLRGALYFNAIPNNDSLQPVITFIEQDIRHLFNTFKWKNP